MSYALKKDGATIKEFPTKDQCAVEVFERRLAVRTSIRASLVAGSEFVQVIEAAPQPTLADLVGSGVGLCRQPVYPLPIWA